MRVGRPGLEPGTNALKALFEQVLDGHFLRSCTYGGLCCSFFG